MVTALIEQIQGLRNTLLAATAAAAAGLSGSAAASEGSTCLSKDQYSDIKKLYKALEGRRVIVDASRPYSGPHKVTYDGVIAESRTVALIKNARDEATGERIHDSYATGTFFYSKCHLITNRHVVNRLVESRTKGHAKGTMIIDRYANPVGKIMADIEVGHAQGRIVKATAKVIHAEEMFSEGYLDGDLAILRLDRPIEDAQISEFLPYDDPRKGDGVGLKAVTFGYSYDLQDRKIGGVKLVADLSCEVRPRDASFVHWKERPCDANDLRRAGYQNAYNTSCIVAGGGSGSPIFVESGDDLYSIRGLATQSKDTQAADDKKIGVGPSTMRAFQRHELARFKSIVAKDISENQLKGC